MAIVSGGGGSASSGGATQICDLLLGGTQATFDTSTILGGVLPTVYSHLLVYTSGRISAASGHQIISMQFNADTATNYDDYRLEGSGAAQAVALENLAVAGIRLGFFPGTTATANFVGVASATIHNYRGTTYNKAVEASGFDAIATSSTNLFREAAGGTWKNTAAITSIQLVPVSGSFIAGSRFTLYGLT